MCPQAGCFPWSRPMPHDHSNIDLGGAVPLGSITGHTKVPHDALNINADKVDGEEAAAIVTGARVNPVITKAAIDALNINADKVDGEEAAAIVTKARCEAVGLLHSSTSGRTVNDHHPQAHNLDTHAVRVHSNLQNVFLDDHHAQAHNLNTHPTRNHADLLNIPANQHVVLPGTITNVLSNHTKAVHDALKISGLYTKLATTLTIAAGVITVAQCYHRVETEGGGVTDTLETINGFPPSTEGQFLILQPFASAHQIVFVETGNIILNIGVSWTTSSEWDKLFLFYDSRNSKWCEIGRHDSTI